MKELICISCPNGCHLKVDETTMTVKGNKCPRGVVFAKQELTNPIRTITSTVRTIFPEFPVISVRTTKDISKAKIMPLMQLLNTIEINEKLAINSIVIQNVLDTGADIVTTTSMIEK